MWITRFYTNLYASLYMDHWRALEDGSVVVAGYGVERYVDRRLVDGFKVFKK